MEESDGAAALPVAVVSESFVQRCWPDRMRSDGGFRSPPELARLGSGGQREVRGLEAHERAAGLSLLRQMRDGNLVWYAPKDLAVEPRCIQRVSPQRFARSFTMRSAAADFGRETLTEIGSRIRLRAGASESAGSLRGDCLSARGRGDSRTALILGLAADAGDRSADGSRREIGTDSVADSR